MKLWPFSTRKKEGETLLKPAFSEDLPRSLASEDRLARARFAIGIADRLAELSPNASYVFGLEGPWGSGKTTVLNFIAERLRSHGPSLVVVRFDAWQHSGAGSVLRSLLEEVAAELGQSMAPKSLRFAAQSLRVLGALTRPMKYLPIAGGFAEAISDGAGEGSAALRANLNTRSTDLKRHRERFGAALSEGGLRVVVLIDDLDRLEPAEIKELIQAVKAVATFRGLYYVLAFDPLQVASALGDRDIEVGTRFLEKVVQVSYRLPEPSYAATKALVVEQIKDVLSKASTSLGSLTEVSIEFNSALVAHSCRTPRDLVRLCNRLRLSAPLLVGEVDLGELVLLELLAVRFPKVLSLLASDPLRFVGGRSAHPEPLSLDISEDLRKKKDRSNDSTNPQWLTLVLSELPDSERRLVLNILDELFPGLIQDSLSKHGARPASRISRDLRSPSTLLRALSLGPAPGLFSVAEADQVLAESELRRPLFQQYQRQGLLPEWVHFLAGCTQASHARAPNRSRDLLEVALEAVCKTQQSDALANSVRLAGAVSDLAQALVEKCEVKERIALISWLAEQEVSVSVSHDLVLSIAQDADLWPVRSAAQLNPRLLESDETSGAIVERWLETVEKKAQARTLDQEPELISVLYRWGQLRQNDFGRVRQYVSDLLATAPTLFSRHFENGKSFEGLDNLVEDSAKAIAILESQSPGCALLAHLNQRSSVGSAAPQD